MNSEYYTGWLTHWGDAHAANTSSRDLASGLDRMLAANISVNLYMAHGGTSFGFWSGANGGNLRPGEKFLSDRSLQPS